jgi:two-component system NtrC family sensor kinase
VITLDERGRVAEFNRSAETAFGATRAEMLGQHFESVLLSPASREPFSTWVQGLHSEAAAGHASRELTGQHLDGSVFPLEIAASATPVGGERFVTLLLSDLTAKKQGERELAVQREALRQSEKVAAMGALLAGVAHELNNPLAILMGRSEMLLRDARDPELARELQRVHDAADRCRRIVKTFLAMARQQPVHKTQASIVEVVGAAIDLVAYAVRSAGIELTCVHDTGVPSVWIDTDQIAQVMVNLLVNAQQALENRPPPRQIRVSVSSTATGVLVRVADNGPGVRRELREQIFSAFFTTKPSGFGTGIGLSISRTIARDHGGDLVLEDTQDSGAVFALSLPSHTRQAVPASPPERTVTPALERPAAPVLVIDDEPEVASLLCDILRTAGHQAEAVANGAQALQWLQQQSCSAILSDMRMPDMDGRELWFALKERHPHLLPRLAFITGDTLSSSVAPFLRDTGAPSLEKPFTPSEVHELMARLDPTPAR